MPSINTFATVWLLFVCADFITFLWCYHKMRLKGDTYSLNGFLTLIKYLRGK